MSDQLLKAFDADELKSLRRRLNNWFKKHGRSLPWRETRDPYRIWISEIMLQQTTVQAVIPYYERFLKRFPHVDALASATEEEVLQYWEGLGYYSRGRNLRKAAIVIRNDFHGQFPDHLDELQALPGIGRYTAGAIRSFAFDLPAPIVEANTLRLYCRLLNFDGDPRSRQGEALLWAFAEQLQPRTNPGLLNQALMELGSQVCPPVNPDCENCPVVMHCRSFAAGTQHQVPKKKQPQVLTDVVEATIAIKHDSQYLVRQRQHGERWAGMWDFPRCPVTSTSSSQKLTDNFVSAINSELQAHVSQELSIDWDDVAAIDEIRHGVTRYRIRLICLTAKLTTTSRDSCKALPDHYRWLTLQQLTELPMPVTGRKFAGTLAASRLL